MKWFFAITQETLNNDPDHGFSDCIKVAILSAKKNTTLEANLLFDGNECDFTQEMKSFGVNVIYHRITFYDKLQQAQTQQRPEWPNYMQTAAGAFLRLDIPLIERVEKYVLYTDCDVLFLKNPQLDFCKPEIFAACGQFGQQDYYSDMNSGVIILNLERLRNDYLALVEFMCDNFRYISGYDQELLRIFYNQNWSPLSSKYNWKPYWGENENTCIVHFHGPKAAASRKLLEDATYRENDPSFHTWRHWFFQNTSGYAHYVPLWENYLKEYNDLKKINFIS
ncbi:glycosyltransferase family protein [Entomobacter blattae]|uniref:Glycosyltransferase n=1 Tax=Entomobacter blattae TaxID=2762277 RepID=A0A7H1NQA8_9PROT|nr:hypothetical protein [Entomobacter blattae]QNT77968.1 hypothetical protein JGUZn3_07330 [Entomobacter blattae]